MRPSPYPLSNCQRVHKCCPRIKNPLIATFVQPVLRIAHDASHCIGSLKGNPKTSYMRKRQNLPSYWYPQHRDEPGRYVNGTSPTMPLSLTRHVGAQDKPTSPRHTYSFNRCLVVVGVDFVTRRLLEREKYDGLHRIFSYRVFSFPPLLKLDIVDGCCRIRRA